MTTPEDDLENRVAVLEREVARLRAQSELTTADAGAARVLASGADHDVSEVRAELRAHLRAINALRETQMEMQLELRGLGGSVQELRETVSALDRRVSDGFSTMGVGMAQITALIQTVIESGQG